MGFIMSRYLSPKKYVTGRPLSCQPQLQHNKKTRCIKPVCPGVQGRRTGSKQADLTTDARWGKWEWEPDLW